MDITSCKTTVNDDDTNKPQHFCGAELAHSTQIPLAPLPAANDAFVNIGRAAAEFDVSKPTIQRWRRQGRIDPPIYLSPTKAVYEVGYIRELKAKMKKGEF